MSDAPSALLQIARTALLRAALELGPGEAGERARLAAAACHDAIEQRSDDLGLTERPAA